MIPERSPSNSRAIPEYFRVFPSTLEYSRVNNRIFWDYLPIFPSDLGSVPCIEPEMIECVFPVERFRLYRVNGDKRRRYNDDDSLYSYLSRKSAELSLVWRFCHAMVEFPSNSSLKWERKRLDRHWFNVALSRNSLFALIGCQENMRRHHWFSVFLALDVDFYKKDSQLWLSFSCETVKTVYLDTLSP